MIKFLKKLWKKCFGKKEVLVVKHTSTDVPIILVKPKPTHCKGHNRFKKSCPNCQEAIK